jgi:hypothetical protein
LHGGAAQPEEQLAERELLEAGAARGFFELGKIVHGQFPLVVFLREVCEF